MTIFRGTAGASESKLVDKDHTFSKQKLTIKNAGAVLSYFGPSPVTTANGFPLSGGESITIDPPETDIYIISSAADSAFAAIASL